MYIDKLYERGRLGKGRPALNRLHVAHRFLNDYEHSGFVPSIKCALNRECGGRKWTDTDVNRLDAVDRYLNGVRACGPLYFPFVEHFVLRDANMQAFVLQNGLPAGGRVVNGIYEGLQKALDLILEAYRG